jgi:hypothetical protein
MRMNGNVRCDALGIRLPDDPDDLARCLFDVGREVQDFCDDDLSVLGIAGRAACDQDAVCDPRVVGNDDTNAAFTDKLAGDLADTAIEHLDEAPFRTSATVFTDDLDDNAVTVEQRPHLSG